MSMPRVWEIQTGEYSGQYVVAVAETLEAAVEFCKASRRDAPGWNLTGQGDSYTITSTQPERWNRTFYDIDEHKLITASTEAPAVSA